MQPLHVAHAPKEGKVANQEFFRYNIIMSDNIPSSSNPPTASAPIGLRIRHLRLDRGWSLAELARRAGTSAPSLHRYESGWDRFEVATLRKIATALDARLEIRIEPMSVRAQPGKPQRREVKRLIDPLIWDRDISAQDLDQYPRWIIMRVLMWGNMEQARMVRRYYGDNAIREAIKARGMDGRTRSFWRTVLKD